MDDTGTEMPNARQQELDYEAHAKQLRQRLAQLITSYAEIEAEAEDLRPTADDDLQRLNELDTRIRQNIADLQPLRTQYEQLVAEWDQLYADHGIMTSDTPWTRSMHAFRKKSLNAKSNKPTLPNKVLQLSIAFDGMIAAIRGFREDQEPAAAVPPQSPDHGYIVQSPASNAGSRAAHSVAPETPRRVQFATPLGNPAHSVGNPTPQPPAITPSGEPNRRLALYNPFRAFQLAWHYLPSFGLGSPPQQVQTSPSNSSSTSATTTPVTANSPRSSSLSAQGTPSGVATQRPTPKPRSSFRRTAPTAPTTTQLDFGDETPVPETYRTAPQYTGTYYRDDNDGGRWRQTYGDSPVGLMSSADPHDGNIYNARPMAWDNTYRPMQQDRPPRGSHFYSDGRPTPPVPPSRSNFAPHSGAAPTGFSPYPDVNPSRTRDYDLPPYVPPSRAPTTAEVHRMATDFDSLAAGRGSDESPQITTPLTAATDAVSTSAAAPSISTSTKSAATSAFYRNGNFAPRRLPNGEMPANLVLKELPLKPFDGELREYHEFRDNFLTLIEGQAHLSPLQKLQHLIVHLKGTPRSRAEGYGLSDEAYWDVVEMLEATYGNKSITRNLLTQDFAALPGPTQRPTDLERFHADAIRICSRLKRVGQKFSQESRFQQILLGKLPPPIKLEILKKIGSPDVPPFEILDALSEHINTVRLAHTTGLQLYGPPPKGPDHNRSRPNSRPGSPGPAYGGGSNQRQHYNNGTYAADTENTYVASKQQIRQQCAFCGANHWSARCTVYPTTALRTRRLQALKQCFLCLGGGHWSTECPYGSKATCKHCQRTQHHAAICRTFMGESRPGTPQPTPVQSTRPSGGPAPRPSGGPAARPSTPHPNGGPAVRPSTPHPNGGSASHPNGGSTTSRQTPAKAVTGKETNGVATAKTMRPPSAQNSLENGSGNSKKNRKQQRGNSKTRKGTNSSKQSGTLCHAAAASDENTMQKSGEACSDTGLLPGHQALLQTGRCSNPSEDAQIDRKIGYGPGEITGIPAVDCHLYLRDDEEISLPESTGHCSHPDPEEFDGIDDQCWYPTDDGYAVSASAPADSQAVLLECIKVTAVNPITGASREATAFFDSGSSCTFSSKELAQELKLPRYEERTIHVNTFASTEATVIEGFYTSLILRSP